jgi:DNA replication protein DnaC
MKAAAFPVTKTLDELDLSVSSIPKATFGYLASLEWIPARENLCLVGPAGTGKSHLLVALGVAAVQAGHRVRYFTAAELTETLYRGLADNSVGRVIGTLLRNDLIIVDEVGFAPLDDTGAQLLFRVIAAAYERRALGIASHWPFESWGRFLPEHTTAGSLLDNRSTHGFQRSVPSGVAASQQVSRCLAGRSRVGRILPLLPGFLELLMYSSASWVIPGVVCCPSRSLSQATTAGRAQSLCSSAAWPTS